MSKTDLHDEIAAKELELEKLQQLKRYSATVVANLKQFRDSVQRLQDGTDILPTLNAAWTDVAMMEHTQNVAIDDNATNSGNKRVVHAPRPATRAHK